MLPVGAAMPSQVNIDPRLRCNVCFTSLALGIERVEGLLSLSYRARLQLGRGWRRRAFPGGRPDRSARPRYFSGGCTLKLL